MSEEVKLLTNLKYKNLKGSLIIGDEHHKIGELEEEEVKKVGNRSKA